MNNSGKDTTSRQNGNSEISEYFAELQEDFDEPEILSTNATEADDSQQRNEIRRLKALVAHLGRQLADIEAAPLKSQVKHSGRLASAGLTAVAMAALGVAILGRMRH